MGIRLPSILLNAKQILKMQAMSARNQSDVPKGHIAVYVGEIQRKRFVVPISYLKHPSFVDLLNRSEEEFGFCHPTGGLTIPCREDAFINLTAKLHTSLFSTIFQVWTRFDLVWFCSESGSKPSLGQIIWASSIGLIIVAAMHYRIRKLRDQRIIPRLKVSDTGRVEKLESFPHYVARQMGFKDTHECPHLCKLASEYIAKSDECEDDIYSFFSSELHADSLFVKLVEEFERCILSYFAFHWNQTDIMISQILSSDHQEPKKKLRSIVMAATREQRFERVTKNLKVARVFTTLVEEMKAMGLASTDDSQCTEVMAPMAHADRSPMLLFMGGGMGAGKSTVLKDILKEPFWVGAGPNAVVIEADAFKESDVIYRALNSTGHHHDMLQTAELVHQSSTDAASSLLVTALNEGRDVIMDGTLSWVPFVVQTITMARNVHRRRYRMGAGYKVGDDGTVTENYWERIEDQEPDQVGGKKRKPYRIELVGVVCDAYLAVIRGIRRALMCRRAVRVKSQLKSHKRFANAFLTYCQYVDNARLYCTNALEGPPKFIGWKDKDKTLLVDPEEIKCLRTVGSLNEDASSIYELYKKPSPACESGSVWKDIVLSPSRLTIQQELKYCIKKVEILKSLGKNGAAELLHHS